MWGCGHGGAAGSGPTYADSLVAGRVEPDGAEEQTLLARIAHNPKAHADQIGALHATIGAPYAAASGARCCSVVLRRDGVAAGATRERLVCELEGRWRFVPDVVVGGSPWAVPR
jgi:hypothetical protein